MSTETDEGVRNYPANVVTDAELRDHQAVEPAPDALQGERLYPLELLNHRVFEHLTRALFQAQIDAGVHSGRFDRAELMQGTGERGRDIVLWLLGEPVGFVQCKHSRNISTKLSRPDVARELLKLLLHTIQDPRLVAESGQISWTIATNTDLNERARTFVADAGTWLLQHESQRDAWIAEVLEGNASLSLVLDERVKGKLQALLGRLKTDHLVGASFCEEIPVYEERIASKFFAVQRVVDAQLAERLERKLDQLDDAPKASPRSSLNERMENWFRALGYTLQSLQRGETETPDFLLGIRERQRTTKVLVRGTQGEATLAALEALRKEGARRVVDEIWLVADVRVSKAARKAANAPEELCLTFDELVELATDFDEYFESLESMAAQEGLDDLRVPLGCVKHDIDADSGAILDTSKYPVSDGGVEHYVDVWLHDPAKEHLSVLGEFGTGKTWFALAYATRAARRYREAKAKGLPRPRIPLLVSLRDYAKAISVESLFSEFFFRQHRVLPGYAAFEELNRMGKVLLIFDGFDEMAQQVDRQKMINNFWQLAKLIVPGAKVVLTSRTEHFPDAKESRRLLGAELRASIGDFDRIAPRFEILHLSPLDPDQVRDLILRRADLATADRIVENNELLDFARRPLMVNLIIEALPVLDEESRIDISRIFVAAVGRKLERDVRQERTFTSLADKILFLTELALEMHNTDSLSINYREFPTRIRALFGTEVERDGDLDHWHHDMMGQTMLVRNEHGDYRPAHRSLVEFLVAYRVAASLGVLHRDFLELVRHEEDATACDYCWTNFFRAGRDAEGKDRSQRQLRTFLAEEKSELKRVLGTKPLTVAIWSFLQDMIAGTPEDVSDSLLPMIPRQNGDGVVGTNLVSILLGLDSAALSSRSLQGASLRGLSLEHDKWRDLNHRPRHIIQSCVDLTNADLADANLRDARFGRAAMGNVNFRSADLTGASLKLAQFDGASLHPTRRELVTSSHDELISWDLDSFTVKRQTAIDGAWRCRHMPCGKQMIVSDWGAIRLVDSDSLEVTDTFKNSTPKFFRSGEPEPNLWATALELIDQDHVVAGSNTGAVYIWDVRERVEKMRIEQSAGCVEECAYLRDQGVLVILSYADVVSLSLDPGRVSTPLATRRLKGSLPRSLSFSPDGSSLASVFPNDEVTVFDSRTLETIRVISTEIRHPESVAFHPHRPEVVVAGTHRAEARDVATGALRRVFDFPPSNSKWGHTRTCTILFGHGLVFLVCSEGLVRVLGDEDWRLVAELPGLPVVRGADFTDATLDESFRRVLQHGGVRGL